MTGQQLFKLFPQPQISEFNIKAYLKVSGSAPKLMWSSPLIYKQSHYPSPCGERCSSFLEVYSWILWWFIIVRKLQHLQACKTIQLCNV